MQVMHWLHPVGSLFASGHSVLLVTLLFLGVNFIKTVFFQHLKRTPILPLTLRYLDYKTWHRGPKICQSLLFGPKLLPCTTSLGAALASILQFPLSYRSPHYIFLLSLHGLCSGFGFGFFPSAVVLSDEQYWKLLQSKV